MTAANLARFGIFKPERKNPDASLYEALNAFGATHTSKTTQTGPYVIPARIAPVANQVLLDKFLTTLGKTNFKLQPQMVPAPAPKAEAAVLKATPTLRKF